MGLIVCMGVLVSLDGIETHRISSLEWALFDHMKLVTQEVIDSNGSVFLHEIEMDWKKLKLTRSISLYEIGMHRR